MTDDIQDALETSDQESTDQETKQTYKMITMCTKDNRASLMLTPSHGKHVYALAVITAVDGSTLYTENIETLQRDEKEIAKAIRQESHVSWNTQRVTTQQNGTRLHPHWYPRDVVNLAKVQRSQNSM